MSEVGRYILKRSKKPTFIPESLAMSRIYKFHLRFDVSLGPSRFSKQGASLQVQTLRELFHLPRGRFGVFCRLRYRKMANRT